MNIHSLFCDNFPEGSAYANRFHSLAKGLICSKNNVQISIVYSGIKNDQTQNQKRSGFIDGIYFKQYCKFLFKSSKRYFQIFDGIYGIVHYFFSLLLVSKKNKPKLIILGSSNLLHLLLLFIVGKCRGIKLIRELNEFPRFVLSGKSYFLDRARYRLLDGLIFMTDRLKFYFESELNIIKPSVVVRMTVDTDRFDQIPEKTVVTEQRITLVGDILGEKDGVSNLLDSMKKISKEFPQIKLILVGNISNERLFRNRQLQVAEFGIEDNVEFLGVKNKEEIVKILFNSTLLVLPRPSSTQADGGFPTKLGEYLASGVPTVITRTGEIPMYLKDNLNSFLVEPDNSELFAERVIFALKNIELAKIIGLNGRNVAYNTFSYKVQGRILDDFLESYK
jgi:glycosyltransferase involved in cell wall biosynthesis